MLVDDDEELLRELQEVLASEGFDVVISSDSSAASQLAASVGPDLVLVDLKMPGKSGFELAKEITENPATCGIPVLAMSAFYLESETRNLLAPVGIRKWFAKPLDLDEVLKELRSLLGDAGRQVD
jgi:DNA-binding response OmpR family regulator